MYVFKKVDFSIKTGKALAQALYEYPIQEHSSMELERYSHTRTFLTGYQP